MRSSGEARIESVSDPVNSVTDAAINISISDIARLTERQLVIRERQMAEQYLDYYVSSGQINNAGCLVTGRCPTKGRTVYAARYISSDSFVATYQGELLKGAKTIRKREEFHAAKGHGCFMFHFRQNDTPYCIDATAEDATLGRLINHGFERGVANLTPVRREISGRLYIVFVAKRPIVKDEEVLYDYNDTRKEIIAVYPFLKKGKVTEQ